MYKTGRVVSGKEPEEPAGDPTPLWHTGCVEVDDDREDTQLVEVTRSRRARRKGWTLLPWARRIHVILDNYVIHKSQLVLTALRAMPKIQLHFLPPYCPDDNRIERIWRDLHASVTRNHRCPDLKTLMANVYKYLTTHFQVFYGSCFTPVTT